MKISIVTVCLNSVDTIRDTIESVLAQDYTDIEYIVVDGLSTDGTIEIISEYRRRIDLTIIEEDCGIYDAMNKGIRRATGDFVGVLNSDDVFFDNTTVSKISRCFIENNELDGCYGDLIYVHRNDIRKRSRFYSSKHFKKKRMKFGLMLPHPTIYLRTCLFQEHGYYKLDYRVAADFELIARFVMADVKLKRIPEILVVMREGGISSNGLLWRVHQNFEIVRACKENSIYTNIFIIALKLPLKLLSYLK